MRRNEPSPRAVEGSPRAPDPRHGPSWHRALPWLLSLAVHGALLLWWASLPEPPPPERDEPDLRPIELVELPAVASLPTPVPEPEPTDEPEPTPEPTDEPEPTPTDDRPPPTSPRPPDGGRRGDPSAPPTSSDPATTDPTPPDGEPSGSVSLLGLRGSSRSSSAAPSLRPELSPPPSLQRGQVVRKVAADASSGSGARDGNPRSLSEAGFRARRNGSQVFRDKAGRFKATLKADGRVVFQDLPVAVGRDPVTNVPKMAMPGLAEGLRAASGQELYQQEKKRLLEETFELRLALAVAFAKDKVDRRLKSLYRELLKLWQDDGTSEAARRRALFERWDECEEGLPVALPGFSGAASSELDELRRTGGEQARETIERFIRTQLPAGSPQAYTAEELRRLNAGRRSRGRFAPYR